MNTKFIRKYETLLGELSDFVKSNLISFLVYFAFKHMKNLYFSSIFNKSTKNCLHFLTCWFSSSGFQFLSQGADADRLLMTNKHLERCISTYLNTNEF